ncbi:ATP-binding protein [Jatrophihabitans sp. YIM 134969]
MADHEQFDVVEQRRVPPDQGLTAAMSSRHVFHTAVADLVDNSVDAGASTVHVRVVVRADRLQRVVIGDNGQGMDSAQVDAAMTLGKPKVTAKPSLGHFGVGLKSASFSQAETLTVLTHRAGGAAEGRRMRRSQVEGFVCDVLESAQVEADLESPLPGLNADHGTVVRWDELRKVPRGGRTATDARLDAMQRTTFRHLGVVFHRLLTAERLTLTWDVLDDDLGEVGARMRLHAIDPFGHPHAARRGYPLEMRADVRGQILPLSCTIWPARSDNPGFQIGRGSPDRYQGLYIYRNDRLLSYGGWHETTSEDRRKRLARVAVDVTGLDDLVQMSAEKDSVDLGPDLVTAIATADDGHGTTFDDYIAAAEAVFAKSNARTPALPPVLPPGAGIDPRVKRAVSSEATIHRGKKPLEIRWARFDGTDRFVEIDRKEGVLWLNSWFRPALLSGRRGGLNDVPMVKALLYLLYEDVMKGAAVGAKERALLDYWDEVLASAAEAEESRFRDE